MFRVMGIPAEPPSPVPVSVYPVRTPPPELGSRLAMGLRHSGQWQEEVRNHSLGGGRAPQHCLCFLPAR